MAVRIVPTRIDISAYRQKVQLDGIQYDFAFSFNTRRDRWTMTIFNDAGEMLIGGVPLVLKQDLLRIYKHDTRLPQGRMFMFNFASENVEADRTNLTKDVFLMYEDV